MGPGSASKVGRRDGPTQLNLQRRQRVDIGLPIQHGSLSGDLLGAQLKMLQANGAAFLQLNRQPDPTRIGLGIERIPMGKDAGEHALAAFAPLLGTIDFDQEGVVVVENIGYFMLLRHKIALMPVKGAAVKIHMRPVKDTVGAQPTAGRCGCAVGWKRKAMTIHHAAGVIPQRRALLPMRRQLLLKPALVAHGIHALVEAVNRAQLPGRGGQVLWLHRVLPAVTTTA